MKRTLAAITTIVLAAGLSIAGASAGALADEATDPQVQLQEPVSAPQDAVDPAPTTDSVPTPPPVVDPPAADPPPADSPGAVEPAAPSADSPQAESIEAGSPAVATLTTVPQCLSDSAISYTYNPTDNSGVVTITDTAGSTGILCQPVYVAAVSWSYTQNATWPQNLGTVNNVLADRVGTYPFSAAVTCGQGDIYVSRTHFIVPTPTLSGPQLWEDFLNTLGFSSTTPGYTNMATSTDCFGEVLPIDPALTTVTECGTYGSVTPQVTEGVLYTTVFDKETGDYTVTATPTAGNHFAGNKQMVTYEGNVGSYSDCEPTVKVEGDPEAVAQTCAADTDGGVVSGYITVAITAGVVYTIHPVSPTGSDIAATSEKTQVAPGTYLITAAALPGFILTGVTSWERTVENQAVDCQLLTHAFLPASVSSGNESCSAAGAQSGYIGIDPNDGLSYFIGSTRLTSAKTAVTPGTYTVTAVADPGDAIDGQSVFTITIAQLSASCGQLTTLAFTGTPGINGYLAGAAGLLMLGAALIFVNQARRRSDRL